MSGESNCRRCGKESASVDPEAVEMLQGYAWPGNVRELQNVIKRALAMARRDVIMPDDLPEEIVSGTQKPAGPPGGFFAMREERLAVFEQQFLAELLKRCRGDVQQAAREAQLPRGTLYRLLKKHALNPSDFRE